MIRKIIAVRDPALRKISKPVKKIDKKIITLISDMRETLALQKDPEGVALAAPQVGKNIRLFIINYESFKRIVINPKIIKIEDLPTEKTKTNKKRSKKKRKERTQLLEGCLSLPHYYTPIDRNRKITVKYQNEKGAIIKEEFKGFYAQIIQHEIDHLNGIVFIDRLLEQKKPLFKFSADSWEEVDLI